VLWKPWARILWRVVAGLTIVLIAATAAAWIWARPARPDPFYQVSGPPAKPGVLLRSEAFSRGVPPGARAWRILYTTTRTNGDPALASAIVLLSLRAPDTPRPVVAWTHGTTGVDSGCAPSLLDDPFANVPALHQLIEEGRLYVATDYVGLGTDGSHPYLIGEGEGRSALDAVRAVAQLAEVATDRRVVVWGHSQGGHAALWTAALAPTYAPDIPLAGVAAAAPASDIPALLAAAQGSIVGKIMSSFVIRAYSETYPDVSFTAYVRPLASLLVRDMANRCLAGRKALFSVLEAAVLPSSIFKSDPTAGPLGARLAANIPNARLDIPQLIAQGQDDELVLPDVQARFVRQKCGDGQNVDFRMYPGRDHLSVVASSSPFTADLVAWTKQRFAAEPQDSNCQSSGR
jgi:alpha-beta hydrolase superfamily lysophospholipase